jgi:hypothetical protein
MVILIAHMTMAVWRPVLYGGEAGISTYYEAGLGAFFKAFQGEPVPFSYLHLVL